MHRDTPLSQAIVAVSLVVLIALAPQPAGAIEPSPLLPIVYVAMDGDDDRDCGTPSTRCRTLQHALTHLAGGGEARLAGGIYGGVTTVARPATIAGGYTLPDFSPGTAPTVLDGRRRGPTLRIVGPAWARLQNIVVTGGLAAGEQG